MYVLQANQQGNQLEVSRLVHKTGLKPLKSGHLAMGCKLCGSAAFADC